MVTKVFYVHNPLLASLFEGTIESITLRHEANASEFDRDNWKMTDNQALKSSFIDKVDVLKESLQEWNSKHTVKNFFFSFLFFFFSSVA